MADPGEQDELRQLLFDCVEGFEELEVLAWFRESGEASSVDAELVARKPRKVAIDRTASRTAQKLQRHGVVKNPWEIVGQPVPWDGKHDRRILPRTWAKLLVCSLAFAACGKSKSSEDRAHTGQAGQAGTETGTGGEGATVGGGGTGAGGSGAGTGGNGAGTGGDSAGTGGDSAGTGGDGAGTGGAPDFPTCEEMYDGSGTRCGETPAYPNSCRSAYRPRNVDFDDDTLGYSARDVLAAVNSPGTGALVWFDGEETTLRLVADPEVVLTDDGFTYVTEDNAPPGEGFCSRTLRIEARQPVFRITTDDGRVDWSLRGTITTADHGCGIEQVIFIFSGDMDIAVDLPPEWTLPGATEGSFDAWINLKVNQCVPFCSEREGYCGPEAWGGRFMFFSGVYDENDHLIDYAERVVGEWMWAE